MTRDVNWSERAPHLLDPGTLCGPMGRLSLVHALNTKDAAALLSDSAADIAAKDVDEDLPLTVMIDARVRPIPDRLVARRRNPHLIAQNIGRTLMSIEKQDYEAGAVAPLVAYDDDMVPAFVNELSNKEKAWMSDVDVLPNPCFLSNATTLNLAREYAYQRSEGLLTIRAGATYATDQAFRAASYFLDSGYAGAYGPRYCDERASFVETMFYRGAWEPDENTLNEVDEDFRPEDNRDFMPDDRAVLSMRHLQFIGQCTAFDRDYGRGGSVREWALREHNAGEDFAYHNALAIQHAEGLSVRDFWAQQREVANWLYPNEWPKG